jgi:hypothetical protein
MTDLRTKIVHLLINDHDQHISAASTADVILAMPEIAGAQAQARIAELEDLLGRFAAIVKEDCGSIPSLGEWGDPDDDYIVELAERAALKPKL